MLLVRKNLVTVNILYYMPDYNSIVKEFFWQTEDYVPEIPRVHRFLSFWRQNIDATIQEIVVSYGNINNLKKVDLLVNYAEF